RVGEPTSECRALADVIVDAVADTEQAIKCLRRLDPGFHAIAVAVNTLENRADQLLRQSLAALFDTAPDAIHVLKWKDIYETMEAVTDRCLTRSSIGGRCRRTFALAGRGEQMRAQAVQFPASRSSPAIGSRLTFGSIDGDYVRENHFRTVWAACRPA